MSAISTILTRLRAAIWAIDVRDDIANAIEQCYSDVSNPTLKTEALEAALQNKIDQGEMAALTIGDHTITAAKLASGVIDNTLATSGAAADAKKTGDEIATLKADLGDAVSYDTAQEKKYSERTTGRKNIGALGSHLGAVNAGQVVSVDENGHAVLQKIGISPECNDALFNLLSSIEYHNNDGVERRNNFMAHFADKKIELPSAYQQVLYLEATGTQYIVTSILSQIPFECDIEFYTNDANPAVVGTADSSDSTSRFFLCGVNHRYGTGVDTTKFMITNRFGSNSWNNEDDIWIEETGKYHVRSAIEYAASGVKSYIKFGKQYSSMDIASAPAVGYPICFFLQRNSSEAFAGLLFSAKFAKSGVVLFNGVPCVRKSDGKPGLYDIVNGVFYTNSGTGEFLYGSEI